MWFAIEAIALVLVVTIVLVHVLAQFWGNRWGAHHNTTWIIINFFIGFGLSLASLFVTNANLLIGCLVAFFSYIILYLIRLKGQAWWAQYVTKRAINRQFK